MHDNKIDNALYPLKKKEEQILAPLALRASSDITYVGLDLIQIVFRDNRIGRVGLCRAVD